MRPRTANSALTGSEIDEVRRRVSDVVGHECDRWVGRQVRDLRKARRWSLKGLSRASGLSIGLLSQIERGASSPSLRSLQALSKALGVPAVWFFNDGKVAPSAERGVIVRRNAGRVLDLSTKGIVKQLMTPDLSGALQMLLVTIKPGGSTGPEPYWHPGEECGYVIAGALELQIDGAHFRLKAGDAFRFESTKPHRVSNPGRIATKVVWVTTPPFY